MAQVAQRGGSCLVSFCDDLGNVNHNSLQVTRTGFGLNGAAAIAKPTVTGAKGGNAALASLVSALAQYGLIMTVRPRRSCSGQGPRMSPALFLLPGTP